MERRRGRVKGSLGVGSYSTGQRQDKVQLQDRRHVDTPDLGPDMLGLRGTICRLAERPWPRLGREAVEPALLVAWLSMELTEPIETMETDLRCPFPLLCWASGGWEDAVTHGMEPARPRGVLEGETVREALARWPRREAGVGVEGGGARRLEGWELAEVVVAAPAVRNWLVGGFSWDCVGLVGLGAAEETFLKQMVHRTASPLKMVESSSQRTKTRMLPESGGAIMELLQDEGVMVEGSSICVSIAASSRSQGQRVYTVRCRVAVCKKARSCNCAEAIAAHRSRLAYLYR